MKMVTINMREWFFLKEKNGNKRRDEQRVTQIFQRMGKKKI